MPKKHKQGFTLIELSIVIVIIALVVGAVLVGRDLIDSAQLRKIGSTVEQYRTAATTFKGKYNALPGDMLPAKAEQFGFSFCTAGTCASGPYIGNGLIDGSFSVQHLVLGNSGEAILFWRQLAEAGLHRSSVDTTALINTNGNPTPHPTTYDASIRYVPESPMKGAVYYIQKVEIGRPGFWLNFATVTGLDTVDPGWWRHAGALTPLQALNIERKYDDSHPRTGGIHAYDNTTTTPEIAATPIANGSQVGAAYCSIGTLPNLTYNTSNSVSRRVCSLTFLVREFGM